jgi:hypothetical protein
MELYQSGTINNKIEEVAKLMDPRGFSQFVQESNDLREIIVAGFPSLNIDNLSRSFQENLFWPRNRIVHLADSSHDKDYAFRCFNIATIGLRVLDEMDRKKRGNI